MSPLTFTHTQQPTSWSSAAVHIDVLKGCRRVAQLTSTSTQQDCRLLLAVVRSHGQVWRIADANTGGALSAQTAPNKADQGCCHTERPRKSEAPGASPGSRAPRRRPGAPPREAASGLGLGSGGLRPLPLPLKKPTLKGKEVRPESPAGFQDANGACAFQSSPQRSCVPSTGKA